MDDFATAIAALPVPTEPARPRPSLGPTATTAAFVSQLLAERNRLAPQRARRREAPANAALAYATGAERGVRRMPAGFRKTVVV